MSKDREASINDQRTSDGVVQDTAARSLGDEDTRGGAVDDNGPAFDSEMEVVDLSKRYTIDKVLGKGGMGEVLLATDTRLNRKVAIKRIHTDATRSRTAVNRFLTEAKSIAALNHHNIVQIYDYGRDKDGPFLIMEYVDGGSLLDKCRKGALPVEEAIELACQLCDGLAKAHDAGIVHRDIKPANVLLTSDGIPKLTDFGLAKDSAADSGMTMTGAVLGTLDFMPPEQRRDLSDARSDLWSLAATLYQMLTGKSPKIIKFNEVPRALHDVLGKALEDEREDRYQTAGEFRDALRKCLKTDAPEIAVDLGAGECAQCHAKNDSSRKFCRECAAPLRVKCLNCDSEIPVWDKVCAECGSKQQELIDQLRAEMAASQAKAVQLLAGYDFAGANRIAFTLRDEPDPRFQHLKDWSEKFLGEIEREHAKQLGRNATLLQESLKHEAAYDYQAGIHNLLQVPEVLRTESILQQSLTVASLLSRLQGKQAESQRLEKLIRDRLAGKQLDNLQPEVEALLKLRPDLTDMAKLREQLVERERKLRQTRDECFAAGRELFAAQEYAGCLWELAKIDSVYSEDAAVRALRVQATNAQDRLSVLRKSIAAGIEQKKLQGLLGQVEELLSLHSADEGMQNLHEKLVVREARNAATIREIIERARLLRGKCRFVDAVTELQRIPEELRTREVNERLLSLQQQQKAAADRRLRSLLTTVSIAAVTLLLLVTIGVSAGLWIKSVSDRRVAAEQLAAGQLAAEKLAAEKLAAEKLSAEKLAAEQLAAEQLAAEQLAAEKIAAEQLAAEQLTAKQLAAEKIAAEKQRIAESFAKHIIKNSIGMQLNRIPSGTFTMGEGSEAHQVTLTQPFFLGIHEVTQAQYAKVMGVNPSRCKGENNPVERVSWDEAVEFCRRLSGLPAEMAARRIYHLPTEAEWEYSCRAGTTTDFSFGNDESQLKQYAWYGKSSGDTTQPVGQKKPNSWGLYDMHGNVWEWCQDWYGFYTSGTVSDPSGPTTGSPRVSRGGSWFNQAAFCRSANRHGFAPDDRSSDMGFRVALVPESE